MNDSRSNDTELKHAAKDRPWRDFLRYGGATQTLFAPVVIACLCVLVLTLLNFWRRSSGQGNSVVLYCAQDQVIAEPILAKFTEETGVRVRPVFDSESVKTVGLANRLLAERNHPVCDLFWGNEELRTRQLVAAGVFRGTNEWAAFGQRSRRLVVNTNRIMIHLPEEMPGRALPGTAAEPGSTEMMSRRTKLIKPPESWQELTNSQWRGKISLAFPLFGTTATHFLALRQYWGESNWLVWCRALADNQPFLEEGNSHVMRRVGRGEALIGLTDSDDIVAGQREGLPVAALPVGPESLLIPNTVALVTRPGPVRPEAQRLFEYLQLPEVRAEMIRVGALEQEGTPGQTLRPDWNELVRNLESATSQLKGVFRRY